MSDRDSGRESVEMKWSSGPGNYLAQRQLDYKLVDGVLKRVTDEDSQESKSEKKDN
jgi:hypothetical protein